MVLFKNEESILFLNIEDFIVVIGVFVQYLCYQGGGSLYIMLMNLDNIYEEIFKIVIDSVSILYVVGYRLDEDVVNEELI